MNPIETEIVRKLVKAILDRDLTISVHDEEEYVLLNSKDPQKVLEKTGHSEVTTFRLKNDIKHHVGTFILIHGNDEDLIHDCSDNTLCEEIFHELQ